MIQTKAELRKTLEYEREQYFNYMFPTKARRIMGWIKREPIMSIWHWQKASRKADYYSYKVSTKSNLIEKIAYVYFTSKRNRQGEKLGIEVDTRNIEKGLIIYHYSGGITTNATMGENCHLHGNNCIGNRGRGDHEPPTLGKNVMVGVGAKIIGNVTIADDVIVAAGAVVVRDVLEAGCTVAGVPAKIVKKRN